MNMNNFLEDIIVTIIALVAMFGIMGLFLLKINQ